MALRLVEAFVPERVAEDAKETLAGAGAHAVWAEVSVPGEALLRAVFGASRSGAALDALHERFHGIDGFRVLVLPLDASLPRPRAGGSADEREAARTAAGVSREEVYAKISEGAELSWDFVWMALLSTVVAAIGLVTDNAPAVIGAMVVAPLLGPNVALALGLTLADTALTRAAIRTNLVGIAVAFGTAFVLGVLFSVDPTIPEMASRTQVGLLDLVLALAAGCAGALAYTTGAPTYLIGVMVAVALLPPTVASGLLLGDGHIREGFGALVLVLANVTAVNLVSMATLLAKGMRPRTWWRAERARESARRGLLGWLGTLVLLAAALLLSRRFG
ncbi:MAG: TIGR00341 family protein [Deltaproteobacteria bacterium]|nr:TIGR00341 family protein [Deltaproteobacteria bacterium]